MKNYNYEKVFKYMANYKKQYSAIANACAILSYDYSTNYYDENYAILCDCLLRRLQKRYKNRFRRLHVVVKFKGSEVETYGKK